MARPPQPLGSQDVWAPHINGPGAFIGANPLIAGENFFTQLAIAALGNIAAQQLPALAPARFIPMHLLHERSRTGDFPGTSRLPAAFRAGGIASIGIERVPSSLAQVRFGQAAFALMRPANGSTGCPVLDELAAARPVYRCQLRVSEEIEDALRLDSCVEWLQDDGSSSEVKRTYADTELEDFEFLMSGSELQSLIAAFFVRGLEAS